MTAATKNTMTRHKVAGAYVSTYSFVSDQTGQTYLAVKSWHPLLGSNAFYWHVFEARADAQGHLHQSSEFRTSARLLADVPAAIRKWEVKSYR